VALPYAIANALFGGTAEYVALWFKSAGSENGFYLYAAGTSAVGLLIALTMRETRTYSRIDNEAGEMSTEAPRQHLKIDPVSGE
jgi:MFS transporter, MHS family, alpha-ketoglutarate permease